MASTAAQKRPRTASREVRRRQLIEATIDCIAEKGISGTTMAEVTKRAQLSMGLVSFHFQSKENLLQETLVYLAEEHRARWVESLAESELAPAAKLAAVMDAHFHPDACNPTRNAVWFAFFGEAPYRDVYRARIAGFDNERAEIVTGLCRDMAAEGYPEVEPEEVAINLESLADGLWLSILLYPHWMAAQDGRHQIHAFLRAIFPRHFETWPGQPLAALEHNPETPAEVTS